MFGRSLDPGQPQNVNLCKELEDNGKLPFLGMVIIRNGRRLVRKVYVKAYHTGLSLHHGSHVDAK